MHKEYAERLVIYGSVDNIFFKDEVNFSYYCTCTGHTLNINIRVMFVY